MIRRGEGGWVDVGGPSWSPGGGGVIAFLHSEHREQDAGDHEGPHHHSSPPSPLRIHSPARIETHTMTQCRLLMRGDRSCVSRTAGIF